MRCPYSRQEARAVIDLFHAAISGLDAALQAAAPRGTACSQRCCRMRASR